MLPQLLLAATILAAQPGDAAIARTFVSALAADDFPALLDRVAPDVKDGAPWRSVREAIERYDCIDIHAWRVERSGDDTLTIVLDADAVVSGSTRKPRRFPRVWLLKRDGARVVSAEMLETAMAREIVKAPERRRELFRTRPDEVDTRLLLLEIVETAIPLGDATAAAFVAACAREIGDRVVETYALRIQAGILRYATAEAREAAAASLDVAMASGEPDALASGLFVAGIAAWHKGDADEGVKMLMQSAGLIDLCDDPRLSLKSLHMVGHIEGRRSNYANAFLLGERTLELSRKYRWLEGEMNVRFGQSGAQSIFGNLELAHPILDEALRLARRLRNRRWELMALSNIASNWMTAGDAARAVPYYREAFAMSNKSDDAAASILTSLAFALTTLGKYEEAEEAIRASQHVEYDDLQQTATTLVVFSALRLAQGKFDDALRISREAIAVGARDDSAGGAMVSFASWGPKIAEARALRALGDRDAAAAAYREAIALIEVRRASVTAPVSLSYGFLDDKSPAYRELAELLVEMGNVEEAIAVADAIKARALVDTMQHGRRDAASHMSAAERNRHGELNARIARLNLDLVREREAKQRASLERDLAVSRIELADFESTLYARYPVLRARQAEQTIEDPRQLVPNAESAIVAYLVGEKKTTAFVIRSNAAPAVATIAITRKELEARVSDYVRSLQSRDLRYKPRARALYELLVTPVAAAIADAKVVCIVPDAVLWRLPFPTLRAKHRALVDEKAVFYAPSLAALRLAGTRARERSRKTLLAFGNPAFHAGTREALRAINGEGALGDLQSAEKEVREVAKMYASSLVLYGSAATETVAKRRSSDYDVVHFATHALVTDSQPMYSSIVLSGSESATREDGLLEARELLALGMRADLVVLSACSTARGDIRSGEGLVGLAWAFLIAGSPTTVGSQWKVSSQSTAELMIELHRALTGDPRRGKAEALRAAQLALRKKYSHPFYWSAFIVIGAGW